MNRLIRRALLDWQEWRDRRRLHRAIPELKTTREAIKQARDRHGRGAKAAMQRAHEIMTERLRAEIGARQ